MPAKAHILHARIVHATGHVSIPLIAFEEKMQADVEANMRNGALKKAAKSGAGQLLQMIGIGAVSFDVLEVPVQGPIALAKGPVPPPQVKKH